MSENTILASTTQNLLGGIAPKFAVSYLRVSTRGQAERGGGHDEGFSIPAQREANKRKALSMGAIIGKEFVDRGASAKSADRPQLQEMLKYVKENADRVDYVIVHKVDRLARNRDDDSDIMRTLRECGVQLVSASESIDDTPAGMLLHGIMSSIAEFYSQNLATEVRKGLNEKVKGGGTVSRCPLGYLNVRRIDEKGREERTVEVDPERAPLIKLAFEEYATGNWTVNDLADHLAACGLTTRATPKIPSEPIGRKALNQILINPYYKGIIKYCGAEYQGAHEPLVSNTLWDEVQAVLSSHINGERTREHPHFLKGSVFCGICGSRMIISNEKKPNGVVYPYFVCAGRHSKRKKDCKLKAVLIDVVERQIEKIYDGYSLPSELRCMLENQLGSIIDAEQAKFSAELSGLQKEKEKLEHKRKKLLEAHYSDAIPLSLLKSEQAEITKRLNIIEHDIKMHDTAYEEVRRSLTLALDLIENCGQAYRQADDTTKRLLNQAIFKGFYIYNEGEIKAELAEPFDQIVPPIMDDIARITHAKSSDNDRLADAIEKAVRHIQTFFGCGASFEQNKSSYPNESNFFDSKSSSKNFLVDLKGFEPTTLRMRTVRSPN